MMYFTLPSFYDNFYLNNFFVLLSKGHKYLFNEENMAFSDVTGNFPYCSWNGGYNNNSGVGAYYADFHGCLNQILTPVRLNCSNIYLEDNDFYDSMAHVILEAFENGSHSIAISNLKLMPFLQEKYPNLKFVFSREAHLITPFTPDLINTLIESEKFSLIEIPASLSKDFTFLKEIEHRNKIEITINPICGSKCSNLQQCQISQHYNQINYSDKNIYKTCMKCFDYLDNPNTIPLSVLKEQYLTLGINRFNLSECVYMPEEAHADVLGFLIRYFIKPEYQALVYERWHNSGNGKRR